MPSPRLSALAIAVALAGCSTMKIRTEYDPKAPYAEYKTWAFMKNEPGSEQAEGIRNPAARALVLGALERGMAQKGLVKKELDQGPDFLVSVLGWTQRGVQVTNYGYNYGVGYAYGPYHAAYVAPATTQVQEYTDGTLVVDFVDAKTKTLVWRGTASDTLTSPDRVPAIIDEAVTKLLAAYPPKK